MSTYLYTKQLAFILNNATMSGVVEIVPPDISQELREITVIGDIVHQFESAQISPDADFSVTCRYDTGSATQGAVLNHLLSARINGTIVSASAFELRFGTKNISGSCVPTKPEWSNLKQGNTVPELKFNFKLLTTVAGSLA